MQWKTPKEETKNKIKIAKRRGRKLRWKEVYDGKKFEAKLENMYEHKWNVFERDYKENYISSFTLSICEKEKL